MKIKKIAKTLSTRIHALTVVLIVLALEQAIFAQIESVGLVATDAKFQTPSSPQGAMDSATIQ